MKAKVARRFLQRNKVRLSMGDAPASDYKYAERCVICLDAERYKRESAEERIFKMAGRS